MALVRRGLGALKGEEGKGVVKVRGEVKEEVKTVVIVGTTGHGKSSLANFLCNLNLTRPDLSDVFKEKQKKLREKLGLDQTHFKVGGGVAGASTTKACSAVESNLVSLSRGDRNCGQRVRIIDTPGLDDPEPLNEISYMLGLVQLLQEVKQVHGVILCVKFNSKAIPAFAAALRYYLDLFRDLFERQQAMLVITNCPSDATYNLQEKENGQREYAEKAITNIEGLIGVTLRFVQFVDSCPPIARLGKAVDRVLAGSFKKTMPDIALLARENIFAWLHSLPPVDMTSQLFRLPPVADALRVHHLRVFEGRKAEMQKTVSCMNEVLGLRVEKLEFLMSKCGQLATEIEGTQRLIDKYEGEEQSHAVYHCGMSMIHLSLQNDGTLISPIAQFKEVEKTHNCSVAFINKGMTDDGKGRVMRVEMTPDHFCFMRDMDKENGNRYRWYGRAWLSWDGRISNAERILELQNKKMAAELERGTAVEERDACKSANAESQTEFDRIKESLSALQSDCDLFGSESFCLKSKDVQKLELIVERIKQEKERKEDVTAEAGETVDGNK